MSSAPAVDEEKVRRWLGLLRHPNRLDSPEMRALLSAHGRLPADATPLDVGRAAARFLSDTIDRLAAPPDAPAGERLPHASCAPASSRGRSSTRPRESSACRSASSRASAGGRSRC